MEIRQYATIVLRWWWLIILMTVAAAAASYAVSQRQTPVYQASTTLMVGESIQATQLESTDISISQGLARTYADIARRQPVLQGVIETLALGDDDWQSLKKRVRARPVEDTQLLEITVEAGSPEEARLIADEVAYQLFLLSPTALQNQQSDANQRFVGQRLEDLQSKIQAGQGRIQELEAAMAGSLSAQQVQELQSEINTLEGLIADWEDSFTQLLIILESKKSPNYLAIIESAQSDPRPIRPKTLQNTILGAMVGFLLAVGLVLLLEFLDDTVKSTEDLDRSLGLPTLGTVTRVKGKHYKEKLISAQDSFSPVSEAYRRIRSNIQFTSVDRPIKSIMVTSATPGEGKSFTAANLGIAMAQAGLKTIVVDTDLRRPVQHQVFTVPNLEGLTDLLRAPAYDLSNHLKDSGIENLQVMTCGELPPNPAELLGSERMRQVIASLNEVADVVIYDSSPAAAVTDAAVLSNRVDGVVLVIEAGQTARDAAREAIGNLQGAGANLLGGVLNRVSHKGGSYYLDYYTSNGRGPAGKRPHYRRRRRWRLLPFSK